MNSPHDPGTQLRAELALAPFREVSQIAGSLDPALAEELFHALEPRPRTLVAGQGRSGLVARAFAQRLMHLGATACVVGDVTCPAVTRHDLIVLISGSGTTESTVRQAKVARSAGAQVAAVTARRGSELAGIADVRLILPADVVPSRQFASTLFSQCLQLVLDGVCMQLAGSWGQSHADLAARHSNLE